MQMWMHIYAVDVGCYDSEGKLSSKWKLAASKPALTFTAGSFTHFLGWICEICWFFTMASCLRCVWSVLCCSCVLCCVYQSYRPHTETSSSSLQIKQNYFPLRWKRASPPAQRRRSGVIHSGELCFDTGSFGCDETLRGMMGCVSTEHTTLPF